MLQQKIIKEGLNTSYFGKYLFIIPEVDSTNAFAREKAREGAPEGSVIITDHQTSGRGRMGRVWESQAGKNILMSIILRPRIPVSAARCITLATATIVIRTLKIFLNIYNKENIDLQVKWPNDVLLNGKKVAGILTESSVMNQRIEYLISGIGININQKVSEFSPEVQNLVTSLSEVTGEVIDREKLIAHLLVMFEKQYIRLERSNFADVIADWKTYWHMVGKAARIETPVVSEWGEIIDINQYGSLLYKTEDGLIKELVTGNVHPE
jgi:BirA family biotin operon repressor/biotin-[acetyl-CoA-carboxylase] ligase